MRRLALILCFAPFLHAATFRFDPPVPTNDTPVRLTFYGRWPDGCPSVTPAVTVTPTAINLVFPRSQTPCPTVLTPFKVKLNLGVLSAGVRDLILYIPTTDFPYVLGATKLVVRDVTTFTIDPAVGEAGGGTHVTIASKEPFDAGPLHVSFDGREVPVTRRIDDRTIEVVTAGHRDEPVTVVVESAIGGRREAPAAFTFYSRLAFELDPFIFTHLLFPIDFAGPGGFGSQWTTESWLETGAGKHKFFVGGSVAGLFVPVLRTEFVAASSRIRDLSRSSQTAGTAIPVVPESAFADRLRLLNIPTGSNLRALLRVWTTGEPGPVSFNIDQIPSFAPQNIPLETQFSLLRYGTVDLTPFLNSANDHLDLSASTTDGTWIWGMVSITNNDTQQVTIVSPP